MHSNDGLLVHDRDGDGKITDGGEIFGDNTPLKNGQTAAHGFAALAELDENGDGRVDAADKTFSKLGVWRDLNHNGISEEGEIFALKDLRIKSLNLGYTQADKDLGNGNTLAEVGSYTDEDGNKHIMGDLRLAADRFNSRYRDSIPLTDEQQQVPNLRGSGRVRDLREAAAQSPDVAAALQAYANAQTKEEQLALRDQLLRAWAGTDKRFTTEGVLKAASKDFVMAGNGKNRGNAIPLTPGEIRALGTIEGPSIWSLLGIEDPDKKKKAALHEKIGILDAFTGTDSTHLYYGTKAQAQQTLDTIEKTYANLADNLYDGLLFQTRLKPYLNAIRFGMSEDGKLQLDYSGVAALFDEVHAKNPGKAFTDLGELLAKGNADGKNTAMAPLAEQFVQFTAEARQNGTFAQYADVLGKKNLETLGHRIGGDGNDSLSGNESANYLSGENGDDTLNGYGGNDILNGGAGNDILYGNQGQDTLHGDEGNDRLYGGEGSDILDGGAGNDLLDGGHKERDTYLFRAGHGKDTVSDYAIEDKDADTLRFSGAKAADSRYRREGYHLIVNAYGENDAVTLNYYFYGDNYQRYNFQFEDAVVQRKDFIAEKTLEVSGTEKNDSLQGWVTKDVIHGGAGNDSISADAGDDLLHGDSGDDVLHGNQGQDTLHGDEGNDRLYGGEGSDILDGGAGNDLLDGGHKERDTYLFRAGHGKDTVSDYAIEDKDADTLRFSGAKAADSRYRREGYHLIVNAYGENDAVTLNNYFYSDNYSRYNFHFDDATFKAAELRGKDLPTEGLKAPVAATAQADAAMPDSATAAVTPQENAATATADESKAQAAKASEKIIEVDTFHPPLRLHKDDTASTGAAQKADSATVSGNDAGKNVLAAQTPANMANPSAATNAASAATAPASDKPQTAAVASADSSAASKADTQSATVQQNAESVNAALKTGGAAATPASTLDAKAAQQSQQMLSAMATQSQTATPTALAAPDLQPKPQLVASQV